MYDKRRYDGLSVEEKLDTALELLDQILYAFPDGTVAHRQSHQAWIQAKEAEIHFWQELKLDIAKKGLWGLSIIILGLLIAGISVKSGVWFR
jgi:hypothetical protein